jgi:hypothetical protein
MTIQNDLESAAARLAESNADAEPNLVGIYLFRDPEGKEIRLAEVDPTAIPSNGDLKPYYFAPDSEFPFWSAIALIRPEEVGNLQVPEGWVSWENATLIWQRKEQ